VWKEKLRVTAYVGKENQRDVWLETCVEIGG